MNEVMQEILIQMMSYMVAFLFGIMVIFGFQRGFLWTYMKVRTSFGRYLMVKIRTPLRDYFVKGEAIDNFLVFKDSKKEQRRLVLDPNEKQIYRCMSVNWIDVEEDLNSIGTYDYRMVTGFDAVKYDDLNKRALMRPALGDNKEKIMLLLLVVIGIISLASAYLSYSNNTELYNIKSILIGIKGIIVPP